MDLSKSVGMPCSVYSATGTAGTAAAVTFAKALQATAGIYITKLIISCTAAPSAAVEATLTGPVDATGNAVTVKIEISANAFAPIVMDFGSHPLKCKANTDAVLTVPAVGGAAIASVQLFGYYDKANA